MEEIFVPALGMAMEEAVLVEWVKQPGDTVKPGETVAVIETDKSTMDLVTISGGTLGGHRIPEGASVAVGTTITVVLGPAESERVEQPKVEVTPATVQPEVELEEVVPAPAEAGPQRLPHALSPRQRRLAAAKGAPPVASAATDVSRSAVNAASRAVSREAIARSLTRSWSDIPHFAVARDVDATGVLARLDRERRTSTVRLTITDVLLQAFAGALSAIEPGRPLGLAVATERGVMIPVLSDLSGRSLLDVARERADAVERARAYRTTPVDGTVPIATLSNLGTYQVSWFTGIIPVNQKGLLTVGSLADRPVAKAGLPVVQPMFTVILNADHRHWDGADCARILDRFAAHIHDFANA